MNPFTNYPDGDTWKRTCHFIDPGTRKKVPFSNGGCRRGYGLKLMMLTGQTACAYCEESLVDEYRHWLLMAVDHVVPTKPANKLGVPKEWVQDYRNTVLACSACNGFRNRWQLPEDIRKPTSFEAFLELRDRVFQERKRIAQEAHKDEQAFYDSKPWKKGAQ